MKITHISNQKNNNRVNIFINGKFAFGLSEEIRYKYGLKANDHLDKDFINQILLEEEENRAFNELLKYLSYRQRSIKESREFLEKKGFDELVINNTLDKGVNLSLLNDLEFAKSFAKDKVNINKFGPNRIKYELKLKGIDEKFIDKISYIFNEGQYEAAIKIAEKQVYKYRNDDFQKKYRKLSGFLQRRGYDYSIINDVVKKVLNSND